jgi:hypothetical protein
MAEDPAAQVSAAPVEAPAPPAPAPEVSSAPAPEPAEAPPDRATQPSADMWGALKERLTAGPLVEEPASDRAATPSTPATPSRPARSPGVAAPASPAEPGPRKWAGQFQTPEDLERDYVELSRTRDRIDSERQRALDYSERIERLLALSFQQNPQALTQPLAPSPPPPGLQQALEAMAHEHELLAIRDPQANPLRLIRAMAVASHYDDETRRVYEEVARRESMQRQSLESQVETLRNRFFTEHPDLQQAHPSLLRQVAEEAEIRLRQGRRDQGSPEFIRDWFAETARDARRHLRVADGGGASPAAAPGARGLASPAAPSAPPTTPRPASRGAPFAETPSPRAVETPLTGQDVYLARVFGRAGM